MCGLISSDELHVLFFFFFSSRRRHTRCSRDWSSDVCSSDLRVRRLDTPPKVDGGAVFGIDVRVPGMLVASIERCPVRSEEHTSELQSRLHLVCRLLLEKKKN